MRKFPPSISPKLSTLAVTIVNYILINDFTAQEQVAIGNWLIQAGQTIVTTAQFQRVIEERISPDNLNINNRQFKNGGSPYVKPEKDPYLKNIYNQIYK